MVEIGSIRWRWAREPLVLALLCVALVLRLVWAGIAPDDRGELLQRLLVAIDRRALDARSDDRAVDVGPAELERAVEGPLEDLGLVVGGAVLAALVVDGRADDGHGRTIHTEVGIRRPGRLATVALGALSRHSELSVEEIAETALRIAAEICIYTNDSISVVTLP